MDVRFKDERKAPWCWQEKVVLRALRKVLKPTELLPTIGAYTVLTEIISDRGDNKTFKTKRQSLGEKMGVGRTRVDHYLNLFEELGLISKRIVIENHEAKCLEITFKMAEESKAPAIIAEHKQLDPKLGPTPTEPVNDEDRSCTNNGTPDPQTSESVRTQTPPTCTQVGVASCTGTPPTCTVVGTEKKAREEESFLKKGAGAPELAEGQISGPEEAPEEEAEEAPEEAPEEALEEEAKKFLDPNIARPWEEAPEEEQLRPAKAPPKRATFAEVEAGLKYTMPKKPLKKDLGRGPSAGAVAPAAADPSGPDHSETTLAGWGQRKWAKAFLAAYQTTNRRVQGEERLSVLDKTVQELRNLLGSEGLTHQQQYHLMCEWLPKNLAAYKFKGIVAPAYLANKLHEYLPAWKRAARPRRSLGPTDFKPGFFRDV